MNYIEELKSLVCGQVERYIKNVLRQEYIDNDERHAKLRDKPSSMNNNASSLMNTNNPLHQSNMIHSLNTPFDHIDRILLQDFSAQLLNDSKNYFRELFNVKFVNNSIVECISMLGNDEVDYTNVNDVFSFGKFFIDSFTYTPFIDYSTIDSKVGIYSDEYLTKYNNGWYDIKSNFVDCNRRPMTNNLYELRNLEQDLHDARTAFRNAIQDVELTSRNEGVVPANAKVYIYTLCEHLITLFAKLSNIRMCHEFYGLKSPHSQWDGILALDIWYNMLYKEIDCGYAFDESYFDVNPMSKLKIYVEKQDDQITRRYVEYQGEQYDVEDETYTIGDYTIMTNGVDEGYALLWDEYVFKKIDSNAKKINDDRKWHVLPRGVLGKIYSIVNRQIPINIISDDSSGDFEWFMQSGNVYSDSSKSKYTQYTNLHLGRAYDVMTPIEYCEVAGIVVTDGHYEKPFSGDLDFSFFKSMVVSGCEALDDAFSVIKNEKLFNIFNSNTSQVEEFNQDNIEHYSESQCAIVIERIFSRLYKYLQFKSTTSEKFEKHINIDSGYKYLTTESLNRNDNVEYNDGKPIKNVYYDEADLVPYLRYMAKLRQYLDSDILTTDEKLVLKNVVGDNGILTKTAYDWINQNWDLCPLTGYGSNEIQQMTSRVIASDDNLPKRNPYFIRVFFNIEGSMRTDEQFEFDNSNAVIYSGKDGSPKSLVICFDGDFEFNLTDIQLSPYFQYQNTKIDYELLGYSTIDNGQVLFSKDGIVTQNDFENDSSQLTLFAIWKPTKYVIEFNGGSSNVLGEMSYQVVVPGVSTKLNKCEFYPGSNWRGKIYNYYVNDDKWESVPSKYAGPTTDLYRFDHWEYRSPSGETICKFDGDSVTIKSVSYHSYPVLTLCANWIAAYDKISFAVMGEKYCEVLIDRKTNLLTPPREPILKNDFVFLGWDRANNDYLSGIRRDDYIVCNGSGEQIACMDDDLAYDIVCNTQYIQGYKISVNARYGDPRLKQFSLTFKFLNDDLNVVEQVEHVFENTSIPLFHVHDEILCGNQVKKFRYWLLESGNISSSMTLLSDSVFVAVYDDVSIPTTEVSTNTILGSDLLLPAFEQISSKTKIDCQFNSENACLYSTNNIGANANNLNPKNDLFDSIGGSCCPFVQLMKLGISEPFNVATIIEIDDVTKLIQALFKINIDIAHREYFLKIDLPNDTDWWYGYKSDEKWISFEPTVEYKFSNMHALNQPIDGKLVCSVNESDVPNGNRQNLQIIAINRDIAQNQEKHFNDVLYYYDYIKTLNSISKTNSSGEVKFSELPMQIDDQQKYYSIVPLCLYENLPIQSPVDVNGFVKHRLESIHRTNSQVQTYTSIVKKYRPIIVPKVSDIFNDCAYKIKHQVDIDNSYGVYGWCTIPSKTMVNMEYNEHSIIVPSSYDKHNHVCCSNFLQMDDDLSSIYTVWDSNLGRPVSNIKNTWYYLYNQRDWTYFLKPFFNINQNNDVYTYKIDTFVTDQPVSSDHLNGVIFEQSIQGRTADSSFMAIAESCRFLSKYHHNRRNLETLVKISNEIIPFAKLRELTSVYGEYNSTYGSEYQDFPKTFRYPIQDFISDFDKTSTYTIDYKYNIGQRHAIDDFDEDSVWLYITMTSPIEKQISVIDVSDIMPYVFWWSNRGLSEQG